jgi:hypothetical protein
MVVGRHLIGYPRDIAPKAPTLGFHQESIGFHGDFVWTALLAFRRGRGEDQGGRVRFHLSVNTLIGAGDECIPFLDISVYSAVSTSPI